MRSHRQRLLRLESSFKNSYGDLADLAQERALRTVSDEDLRLLHDVAHSRHNGSTRSLTRAEKSACAAYGDALNRELSLAM